MFASFKTWFYFPLASYFRFFARIRLNRWHPKIIVVTGSNGKTTLLHLLESQMGERATYSHHANSSFGIPFDILGLHRKTLRRLEWLHFVITAPFRAFGRVPKETIYIVEADADRPGEGKFLAELLMPDIVLWVSTGSTHTMNFDRLVTQEQFATVEEAIAFEFGYFVQHAKELVVIDGESSLQRRQVSRTRAWVNEVKRKQLQKYRIDTKGTHFQWQNKTYSFTGMLPEIFYVSLGECLETMAYLDMPVDTDFRHFIMPPGRGTMFAGIHETLLIDSSYNANKNSIEAMVSMFAQTTFKKKWVVLGDMLELGEEAREDHEAIAHKLLQKRMDQIILVGKISAQYMFPILQNHTKVVRYDSAKDALLFLRQSIRGGEAILFKGSQSMFLEGIIEHLLRRPEDKAFLPRRGTHWENKRSRIGL